MTNQSSEKGKTQRKSREVTGKFVIRTKRDFLILKAVCECGGLTALQISQLHFPLWYRNGNPITHRYCHERLWLLHHDGKYIKPVERYRLDADGRPAFLYRLTPKGRKALAGWLGWADRDLPGKGQDTRLKPEYSAHLIRSNDVRVAFMRAVSDSTLGARLSVWRDEVALKREHSPDRMTIRFPSGKQEKNVVLVPDAYFQLDVDLPEPGAYDRFVEIDLATEIVKSGSGYDDWVRKVRKYVEYTKKGGLFRQRYGVESVAVLTVTTSDARLAHLKAITEQVGGKKRFWFTTFDRISPTTILTDPIWEIATKKGRHSFLWMGENEAV
jgi:hypothetical protein